MNLEKLLNDSRINYKKLDEDDGFCIYKINEKLMLLYMQRKSSDFELDRDVFDYLDGNKLPYAFFLESTSTEKYFLMKFPNKNNWIKGSFDSCDKQVIHLGKQVLNNMSTLNDLINYLNLVR